MKTDQVLDYYKTIINSYLKNEKTRREVAREITYDLDMEKIFDFKDEFISDCYVALKHMTEEGFETLDSEIIYYKDCLEGKRKFLREDRDEYLVKSQNISIDR